MLAETGMKNAQTGLKSSRPLDRADPELSASEQRMLDKSL